jgi:hypothetical protein
VVVWWCCGVVVWWCGGGVVVVVWWWCGGGVVVVWWCGGTLIKSWGSAPPRPPAILGASGVDFVFFSNVARQVSNSCFCWTSCASGVELNSHVFYYFWVSQASNS